jgi:hypothetical protein
MKTLRLVCAAIICLAGIVDGVRSWTDKDESRRLLHTINSTTRLMFAYLIVSA